MKVGPLEWQSMDRRSREVYLIDVFKPMTYYNIKLSARNRARRGRDWEKQLVAVSEPDITPRRLDTQLTRVITPPRLGTQLTRGIR